MSQVRVKINGQLVERVRSVSFGCDTAPGPDGHPQSDHPRADTIVIVRESDKKTDFWGWATKPFASDYRDGVVEFLAQDAEDKVLRKIEWKKGFVSGYSEQVPDVQADKGAPMIETIEVSAKVVDYGGAKIEAWKD